MDKDINGCGAKGTKIRPPHAIFFKASCDKHDKGYNEGGTELQRWYADNRFYLAMRYDVKRLKRNWIVRQYYLVWCKLYFIAVRTFGKRYFNYKKA